MNDGAETTQSYKQFREAILVTILNIAIAVSFLSIFSALFLDIPFEGILSSSICLVYSIFVRYALKNYSYRVSAFLFLGFLFVFLPVNHYFTHTTGQGAIWWYSLLPMVFVFFLGKEFALAASLATGIVAASMDLLLIKVGTDPVNTISALDITNAFFHAVSIFVCGWISYYFEKYRELSETTLVNTKGELNLLQEKKINEEKLMEAKEEAVKVTEELKNKQNQLDDILANSPGIVYQFHTDADANIQFTYVSDQLLKVYEVEPGELQNNIALILDMVHENDIDSLKDMIIESSETLRMFQWKGRIITGKNNQKYVSVSNIPRKNPDGSVVWNGILLDITKEKEMETELFHQKKLLETSSRLASLGEISAGIAHEINNPLAIILLKLDDLREQCSVQISNNPDILKGFDYIDNAVSRICKIVDSLRYLSKERNANKDDFCRIYTEAKMSLELVRELYRNKGIKISDNITNSETLIHSPSTFVHQILLNLVSNAKDATMNTPDPEINIEIFEQNRFVCLSVEDNGPGIPKNIKDRIFEPFFTTKGVDNGTGIGLSMCYSMIRGVGGKLICESSSKGTKFTCFFEIVEKTSATSKPKLSSNTNKILKNSSNKIKVLVVDDELNFLNILCEKLTNMGYEATPSSSGIDALKTVKQSQFEVIISDQKMPKMTGTDFYREIKTNDLAKNSFKIIMSGHIDPESGSINIDKGMYNIDAIIQKPFKISSLISLLEKIPVEYKGKSA